MPHDNMTIQPSFVKDPSYALGVDAVDVASFQSEGIYSPSGIRRESLQRGLNIIVTADGQKRKVLVK